MVKNYYAILGVLPTATLEEIRSAYRTRAKQFHPDHFGHDSSPFLNVQEAYEILGDPVNRAAYDRRWTESGAARIPISRPKPEPMRAHKPSIEPLKSHRGPETFEPISPLSSFRTFRPSFDEIWDNLQNIFDIRTQRKGERFQTITMEVQLTPDQANRGGRMQILLPIETICPTCRGHGALNFWECWRCNGTAAVREELPLEIEYPPGIQDHYQVGVPLDRFGIHDICPILLFRISPRGDLEEL